MENKEIRLTKNSKTILERRYLLRNDYREIIETPKELFMRVARSVALAEKEEERERYEQEFFNMMAEFEFLPNSPTLMNAGTELGMLSACFVIPVIDSIEGIFDAVKNVAVVHRLSGGTGMSFSELRPAGDLVSKTKGKASGPLSFMTVFNAATETIIAGGKRRGANMGTLRVDHPDIEEFIVAKDIEGNLSNFNISVTLTDKFMDAYRKGYDFDLINPKNGEVKKTVRAKEIFDKIVKQAWKNGEPGVIFIDTINKFNPTPEVGEIRSVNPCVLEGTKIQTPKGERNVESIGIGEEITTTLGVGKVKEIEIHENVEVYKVKFNSNKEVICTLSHQFYAKKTLNAEFKPMMLRELSKRDYVKTLEGYDIITDIEKHGFGKVYDLYEPESDTWLTNGYVSRGCGEQPLLPNESCNLASINLSKMVKRNDKEKYELDVDRLKEVTHLGVRFLDDVISVNKFPLQEIKIMTEENRKIGLGVMGFADMLIKLGIRYDSEEAVKMAKKVMKIIQDEAFAYSIELAKERGEFPNFNKSIYKDKQKIRNATRTTIAPTGTISMIAGCSSGIEPLFAIVYTKTVLDDDKLIEVNPLFEEIAKEKGFYSKELMERIAKKGTVQGMIDVPIDIQEIFVAAQDISPEWHIKIQAAFQQYVDNAVSKTCNLPNDATEEDIRKIYEMAYDLGLKGITVYRDGSRDRQVVETRERAIKDKNKRLRPRVTIGQTEKINTGCGGLYITTNQDKEGLFEVFIQMGKAGMCATSQNEAIARLISLGLRSGIQLSEVVEQLKGIRCPMPTYDEDGKLIESCADAIAKVLRNRGNVILEELEAQMEAIPLEKEEKPRCPECQGVLTYEEGCIMCKACGYSKCG